MDRVKYKFDQVKLKNIAKFLEKDHTVKVGVLGISEKGEYKGIDAVTLAMTHEFGSKKRKIPERSFLRLTIDKKLGQYKSDLAANKEKNNEKIATGRGMQFLHEIGGKWERWVKETFAEEGPGWAPLKKRTIAFRKNKGKRAAGNIVAEKFPILQDSSALKRSITHEVT